MRIVLNAGAVLLALVTFAPVGIMVAVGVRRVPADVAELIFWLFFISGAWVGAFAPKKRDSESPLGVTLTMIVIFTVILNLGGCMTALREFGRATGG